MGLRCHKGRLVVEWLTCLGGGGVRGGLTGLGTQSSSSRGHAGLGG
jgi:hypothetical protein